MHLMRVEGWLPSSTIFAMASDGLHLTGFDVFVTFSWVGFANMGYPGRMPARGEVRFGGCGFLYIEMSVIIAE